MKSITTFLIVILFINSALAQQFATMIDNDNIAYLRDFTIVTIDGDTLKTKKLSSYSATSGRLRALTFKTEDGVKHKLKANQIISIIAKLTKFAKAVTIEDKATKSIQSAVTTDYAGIVAQHLVRFNSVEFNQKKGKKALLQLINFGFDQKLKIYPDPASESGITTVNDVAVSGGDIKSYFIVKGDEQFKVNKKNYKSIFSKIYDNCSEMDNNPKSITIKNLLNDILTYNQFCN